MDASQPSRAPSGSWRLSLKDVNAWISSDCRADVKVVVDEKQIAIVVMMKQKKKKVAVAIRETEKREKENWGEVKMAVGNCNIFYLFID